jgi:hypothetical protein
MSLCHSNTTNKTTTLHTCHCHYTIIIQYLSTLQNTLHVLTHIHFKMLASLTIKLVSLEEKSLLWCPHSLDTKIFQSLLHKITLFRDHSYLLIMFIHKLCKCRCVRDHFHTQIGMPTTDHTEWARISSDLWVTLCNLWQT